MESTDYVTEPYSCMFSRIEVVIIYVDSNGYCLFNEMCRKYV